MQFIPPVTCMDQPMFWTSEQLSFLKGKLQFSPVSLALVLAVLKVVTVVAKFYF